MHRINQQAIGPFLSVLRPWGFLALVAGLRLVALLMLIGRFWLNPASADWYVWISIGLYALYSVVICFLYYWRADWFNSLKSKYCQIAVDTAAITWFYYSTQDIQSDVILLYFIPLALIGHYLPRWWAFFSTFGIILIETITTILMAVNFEHVEPSAWPPMLIPGAGLLVGGAGIYRLALRFEHDQEPETGQDTPEFLQAKLSTFLHQLRNFVPFDTASVQLLRGKRLAIVACVGFDTSDEVMRLTFPADDSVYPNFKVFQSRQYYIADTSSYPHFKDPVFHVTHIKSWLGVPIISPITGAFLGMVCLDSRRVNAYNWIQANIAKLFVANAAARLMGSHLVSATLELAQSETSQQLITQRLLEALQQLLKVNDEITLRGEVVKLGTQVFDVEDCSLYYLRGRPCVTNGSSNSVLHLVASSAISSEIFSRYESVVSGALGTGFTGYAVWADQIINLGANDYKRHPYYSGTFTDHLSHLPSNYSRQVLIVPVKASGGKEVRIIGALKIENKRMWKADDPFQKAEQRLFEIFAAHVGTAIERVRTRHSSLRHRQNIHDALGVLASHVIIPLGLQQAAQRSYRRRIFDKKLDAIVNASKYVGMSLDNYLTEQVDNPILETAGLKAALEELFQAYFALDPSLPDKVHLDVPSRLDLPPEVRDGLFYIGREALMNAIRHARISERSDGCVSVTVKQDNDGYELKIADNGRGFNVQAVLENPKTVGMLDMQYQANRIQASFTITSTEEAGSCIKVGWPKAGRVEAFV